MSKIRVFMGVGAAIGTLAGFTALSPLVMGGIAAAIFTSMLLYGYRNFNESIPNLKADLFALGLGFAIGIGLAAAATAILPSESLAGVLIGSVILSLAIATGVDEKVDKYTTSPVLERFSSRRQEV